MVLPSSPFPLLDLAELPRNTTAASMELFAYVNTSLTSAKACSSLKSFKGIKLSISQSELILNSMTGTPHATFIIRKDAEEYGAFIQETFLGELKLKYFYGLGVGLNLITIWPSIQFGFQHLLPLILKAFNVKAVSLCLPGMSNDVSDAIINTITSPHPKWQIFHLKSSQVVDDDLFRRIVSNSTNIEQMIFDSKPSHRFKCDELGNITAKVLEIHDAHWLTLTNFLSLSSETIKLDGLVMTNEEVNQIIKHILNSRAIKKLDLIALEIDIDEALKGIFALPEKKVLDPLAPQIEFKECRLIRRMDGFKIRIWNEHGLFFMRT